MSINITTTRSIDLPLGIAEEIYNNLTNPKSDTQRQMFEVLRSLRGDRPLDSAPDFSMSICLRPDPYTDLLQCIGWASVTEWDRCCALQGFVNADYRGMGLAGALVSSLVVDGILRSDVPVAVFADSFVRIAHRLGFQDIRRYRITDDGWVRSMRLLDDDTEVAR